MDKIRKLDESVINRIAAGEIINRPENVVKELVENCLDAKSRSIAVLVKDGGLKQLVITDNGRGIPKDDFSLVCERFCTSKLHDFQDLKTIATYGFRGEALASVSHVAHVTVVSRTKDSPCAYKGVYSDGALIPQGNASNKKKPVKQDGSQKPVEPKPIAGNIGTQITVDDLFYNLPIRKAAFKNHQEEYIRILGVVQKYAILNAGVAFSCKKYGSHQSDLQTLEKGTQLDNIRNIYGESIANELLKFDHESDKSKKYTFSANGFLSNPNFSIKKKEFIIFINNRLIECPAIRKCIDTVYSKFLPKSGSYSFVFISLSIPPESIDVNVHPTKKHVHFYHEDDVVLELTSTIDAVLTNNDQSRVFTVSKSMSLSSQSLIPSSSKSQTQETISQPSSSSRVGLKTKPHLLVRTDSKTRTLDSFFSHPASSYSSIDSESSINPVYKKPKMSKVPLITRYHSEPIALEQEDEIDESFTESQRSDSDREIDELEGGAKRMIHQPRELNMNSDGFEMIDQELNCIDENRGDGIDSGDPSLHDSQPPKLIHYVAPNEEIDEDIGIESTSDNYENKDTMDTPVLRSFVTVELDSVLYLREEIMGKRSKTATAILQNHTFVGCFDTHLALIQHNTSLLVIEVPIISKDFMYQIALYGFSNFGVIPLDPGLSVFELLSIGLDQCKDEFKIEERGKEIIVKEARELIVGMRLMLEEYFSILIDEEGTLTGLPVFIPGYMPNTQKLAIFLAELGLKVDYSEEKECFRDLAHILSDFYSFTGIGDDQTEAEYYHCVEHFLFAELSHSIGLSEWIEIQKPATGLPCIREIANLKELYKIFERC